MSYAIELDPFNHFSRYWLAIIAFFSRQYEFTIKQLEILSNCDDAIGLSYAQRKRYPEAIASMSVYRQVRGQAVALGQLAQVYGLAGRKRDAQKLINELKERSRHRYVFPSVFANAYIRCR